MRSRIAVLALVAVGFALCGCSSDNTNDHRSMPTFGGDRHTEQINSPGR